MAWRRILDCVCIALLCAVALGAGAAGADAKKKRTVASELKKLYRAGTIDQVTYDTDRAILADVKRRIKRLTGVRKAQLAGVLATTESMAARGQLDRRRQPAQPTTNDDDWVVQYAPLNDQRRRTKDQ